MRKTSIFIAVLAGGLFLLASVAWACTRQVSVSISPRAGPAGTTIMVTGSGFNRLSPVEIRWDDLSGPRVGEVATGLNGTFSVQFQAPSAPVGVYDVIAEQSDPVQGVLRGADRFTLVAAVSHSQQVSSNGSGAGNGNPGGAVAGPPQTTAGNGQEVGATASHPQPDPNSANRGRQQEDGRVQAQTSANPADQAATAEAGGQPGQSQSLLSGIEPSLRTVSQDLWGGFEKKAESFGAGGFEAPEVEKDGAGMVIGLSLLAVGIVGLLSMVAIAEVRLRRVRGAFGG